MTTTGTTEEATSPTQVTKGTVEGRQCTDLLWEAAKIIHGTVPFPLSYQYNAITTAIQSISGAMRNATAPINCQKNPSDEVTEFNRRLTIWRQRQSVTNIFYDLLAIANEHKVKVDLEAKTLVVNTGPITLHHQEGHVALGPFEVTLPLALHHGVIEARALQPNRHSVRSEYVHPHVDGSRTICLGVGDDGAVKLVSAGALQSNYGLIWDSVKGVLTNYNASSAYAPLDSWLAPVCDDCGVSSNKVRHLKCGHHSCCTHACPVCCDTFCTFCMTDDVDGEPICQNCYDDANSADYDPCHRCRYQLREEEEVYVDEDGNRFCEDCHPRRNSDEDEDEAEEQGHSFPTPPSYYDENCVCEACREYRAALARYQGTSIGTGSVS